MRKVFLYLYQIKEYTEMFLCSDVQFYAKMGMKRPLVVLNDCIQQRYRSNGYEIFFATYPDRDVYGMSPKGNDRLIFTDVSFEEASAIDSKGNVKKNFVPKYPNESYILDQIGKVDELVIGGYHALDCVKRVANQAMLEGIKTLIDLDLTDFFFHLYKKESYFKIDEYSPLRYKEYVRSEAKRCGEIFFEKHFEETYDSKAYGF